MAKHIIITTEQNKQQRKENIEKYGTSKKILKHIRNNVRKLSKVNPSIKYTLDLEEYSKVAFEIRPLPSGQSEKIYKLNEEQATLLITYMKNTEPVRRFKKALVKF